MIRMLVWVAAILGLVVGVARLTVLRWWVIPTNDPVLEASVTPTLRGGDLVLLWRATPPNFGALVVCPDPTDGSSVVIGRLTGESGDKILIDGDRISINDQEARTETSCSEGTFRLQDPNTGSDVEQRCTIEDLGGVGHMRGEISGLRTAPTTPTSREVGPGKAFLLSDNRAYPYDSRTFGNVDRETCKESIFFRLWSARGFMDVKPRFTYIR